MGLCIEARKTQVSDGSSFMYNMAHVRQSLERDGGQMPTRVRGGSFLIRLLHNVAAIFSPAFCIPPPQEILLHLKLLELRWIPVSGNFRETRGSCHPDACRNLHRCVTSEVRLPVGTRSLTKDLPILPRLMWFDRPSLRIFFSELRPQIFKSDSF